MKEYLLKRALPFTLTFALGAAAGGFFQFLRAPGAGGWFGATRLYGHERRGGCGKKLRRRAAVLDTRPPMILFKPDARIPSGLAGDAAHGIRPALVSVTFGEDGKVRDAVSHATWSPELSEAAVRAARLIRFIPATIEGAPTTATEEVEIRFSFE